MHRALIAVVAGMLALPGVARAERRVLVWPDQPDSVTADAERTLGERAVASRPIHDLLRGMDELAALRDSRLLDVTETALGTAVQAYLEQRFDDALETLDLLDGSELAMLARPEHADTLWQVQLQRGMVYLARGTDGDAERAALRFGLALSLDAARRPARDLYGPDVAAAFADAVAARAAAAARPVAVRAQPADAYVTVDGVPIVAPDRPLSLVPGLHVIAAIAPGYAPLAMLVDTRDVTSVPLSLAAHTSDDPIARAHPAWRAGHLDPTTPSGRTATLAIARDAGADAVLALAEPSPGVWVAHLISEAGVERTGRGDSVEAAVTSALSEPIAAPDPEPASGGGSVLTRWWFWTGVGAVVAGAVIAGVALSSGGDRLQVVAPRP